MHDRRTVLGGLALGALGASGTASEAGTISGGLTLTDKADHWKVAHEQVKEFVGDGVAKLYGPYADGVEKIMKTTRPMIYNSSIPERWRPTFFFLNHAVMENRSVLENEVRATMNDDRGEPNNTQLYRTVSPEMIERIDSLEPHEENLFLNTIIKRVVDTIAEHREIQIMQGRRIILVAPVVPKLLESRGTIVPAEVRIFTHYRTQPIFGRESA